MSIHITDVFIQLILQQAKLIRITYKTCGCTPCSGTAVNFVLGTRAE